MALWLDWPPPPQISARDTPTITPNLETSFILQRPSYGEVKNLPSPGEDVDTVTSFAETGPLGAQEASVSLTLFQTAIR